MNKIREIREHAQGIFDVCESGNQVFTCSADGYVVSWDIVSGVQNPFVIKTSVPAYSLAISQNLLFVGLNNGDLHWIDLVSKQEVKFFTQHKSAVFGLQYNPVNKRLVSSDADGFVGIWNTESMKLELFFQLPAGKIRALDFSPDGSLLALGGQNGVVYLFETEYFNELHHFFAHQEGVTALLFHPSKNLLFSAGKDAYLRVWDSETYDKIKAFPAHLYAIYGIQFSPDSTQFATCSRDKTIKLWDAMDYSIQNKLDFKSGGHQHSVNAIFWSETGLISVSDDRRIVLWKG